MHVDARSGESGFERRLDHVARDARVLADHHGRVLTMAGKDLARGVAQAQHELRRHRALAHRAAYAVRAEIFSRHAAFTASQTAMTSRVSFTSCTRSIVAPPSSA